MASIVDSLPRDPRHRPRNKPGNGSSVRSSFWTRVPVNSATCSRCNWAALGATVMFSHPECGQDDLRRPATVSSSANTSTRATAS